MPKVSVVIPVYNAEKYIEKCARSLFEQTLDDLEYIFVNDCTPDKSIEVLNDILEEYPNRQSQVIILNHSINTGQSGARRDGIRIAMGDYIIHCDSDDWVDPEMYETMYRLAVEAGADSVCCDIMVELGDRRVVQHYNSAFSDHKLMHDCKGAISVQYFSLCNRLVSRHIYIENEINPFEGVNMWDDVGLSVRIRFFCESCVVISKPFYHYNRIVEECTCKRNLVERVSEQIRCAEYVEAFLRSQHMEYRYRFFISYIKLIAKLDLLDHDIDMWVKVFPEARRHIYITHRQCNSYQIIKSYLASFSLRLCKFILSIRSKVKVKLNE